MNIALEYASATRPSTRDDRYVVWIANGPIAIEVDLWGTIGKSDAPAERRICDALVRQLTRLLAADDSDLGFVPNIVDAERGWQVGLSFDQLRHIECLEPTARRDEVGGEDVVIGDPAFRLVLYGDRDTVTLRTDRAGVATLATLAHDARACLRASLP
jgi:hypothetical protein